MQAQNDPEVAPFTGARIETGAVVETRKAGPASRPSRARGLKPARWWRRGRRGRSRPSRARGLKRHRPRRPRRLWSRPSRARGLKRGEVGVAAAGAVAPFTGARIETSAVTTPSSSPAVAPFTGARIETSGMVPAGPVVLRRALHGRAD